MVIMANNGRFGGGRIPFTPAALLNDGLFDLLILRGKAGFKEVASFVKNAVVQGGHHVYKPKWYSFRGRKVVFTNKNFRDQNDRDRKDKTQKQEDYAFGQTQAAGEENKSNDV